MAIRNQASAQVDDKIDRTAVVCVFNLRNIFALVEHALNNGALPEQQLVCEGHELIGHLAFPMRDAVDPELVKQAPKAGLRAGAFTQGVPGE